VAGRGDHLDARKDLRLAVQHLVGGPGEVDQRRDGVVRLPGGLQLGPLHEHRPPRQLPVAAAVVAVQVAVDHQADVAAVHPERAEAVAQRAPHRPEVAVGLRVLDLAEAAVEQQQAVGVGDQVGADHDAPPGQRVVRRPGVVAQREPADVVHGQRHGRQSRTAAPAAPCPGPGQSSATRSR
jgi:hypothetical protein